ncbi:MAG: diacylglycerol/lipid kinase family protein [Brooklawnia sp.]|jgi:diacylglycerol kinase (ATP)
MAESSGRRVAVVFNPTKINDDQLFATMTSALARHPGWGIPIYLATTPTDPGRGMTRLAVELGAELVLAVGGDGTVRAVTTALGRTGVACAIVPMGTGNLLARNLGVPLELEGAVDVAFTGARRRIDLAHLVVDHDQDNPTAFTGMAGIGFDAAMMRDTDTRLKKAVGNIAYVVAFAQQLGTRPRRIQVQVDDGPMINRRAVLMMVGNTGRLQGGIQLFPEARPDDGKLDVLLAAPTSLGTWARFVRAVMRRKPVPQVEYQSGTKVRIALDEPTVWEADGDTEGEGTHFEFTVQPDALLVVAPALK